MTKQQLIIEIKNCAEAISSNRTQIALRQKYIDEDVKSLLDASNRLFELNKIAYYAIVDGEMVCAENKDDFSSTYQYRYVGLADDEECAWEKFYGRGNGSR